MVFSRGTVIRPSISYVDHTLHLAIGSMFLTNAVGDRNVKAVGSLYRLNSYTKQAIGAVCRVKSYRPLNVTNGAPLLFPFSHHRGGHRSYYDPSVELYGFTTLLACPYRQVLCVSEHLSRHIRRAGRTRR
jgi:hypothetical protein